VLELLRHVPQEAAVIPIQVIGELYHVLVRKAGRSPEMARDALPEPA
jgi:predicted nucleic acid-binding protein